MKKKIYLFGAALAALATFSSCSSEDDIAMQEQVIPEAKSAGVPMVFRVVDSATRGTDLKKSSTFTFKTWSTMSDAFGAGIAFTNNNGSCSTTGDLKWPDNSATEYTFYSVSDVANMAKTSGVTIPPTISGQTVSFTYTIPTTYADQKDLLVATSTGSATGGTPAGSVSVQFNHALAQITAIKVYANTTKLANKNFTDYGTYAFRINGIRLGGLQTVGTYTFGVETPWEVPTTAVDADTYFEIPLKTSELTFEKMSFIPDANNTKHSLPLNDGGLYLIPQTVAGVMASDGSGGYIVSGAYAELDAQVFVYQGSVGVNESGWYHCCSNNTPMYFDEENSTDAGFGKIRVPLKFTIESGKGYTLVLDLGQGIIMEDAMYEHTAVFEGVQFDTAG